MNLEINISCPNTDDHLINNGLEKKVQIDCLQAYVRPMVNKKKVRGELWPFVD